MKKCEKFFKSSTKYIFNQQSATHEGAARGLSPRSLLATPLVVWFTTCLRECMYSMLTPAKQSLSVTPSNQSSAVSKIGKKTSFVSILPRKSLQRLSSVDFYVRRSQAPAFFGE